MSTWNEQKTWRRCYERLHESLKTAQDERDARQTVSPSGEIAWAAVHERDVMHAEVNRLRADIGRPPVAEQAIRRAESRACGHFDYTKKFALYCADIVLAGEA